MGQLIEQMKTVLPPLQRNRLIAVLVGNGLLRLANLGGTALVSFYLGMLMRGSSRYDEGLLAALTIVSSGAELLGAIPFGMLADRFSPRALLVWSALLGAAATQLFGISGLIVIFFLSRALEGLSAAAVTPAILAHLSDVTTGKKLIRGRIMGLFELSIFAGASLSSLLGSQLWEQFATLSFSLLSIVYLFVALLFHWGARGGQTHSPIIFENPLLGLKQVWANSRLRRLAPGLAGRQHCSGPVGNIHSNFDGTLAHRRAISGRAIYPHRSGAYCLCLCPHLWGRHCALGRSAQENGPYSGYVFWGSRHVWYGHLFLLNQWF
ncbi:MAG: MFS transporter [Chloroflexi bacterium]|nr:MFS transporter [Chloroflexota bacterium]